MKQQPSKPLLRWAGSKRKLVPVLSTYWDDSFTRYVEPFAGSACLFFAIQPRRALLGDLNSELIATYKVVRRDPEELSHLLSKMSLGQCAYYSIREKPAKHLSPLEKAARFIYLNRFCFNGLYRTNGSGHFNVPYGGSRTGQLPSVENLCEIARTLRRCSLRTGDFEQILQETRRGDFVYMDPPFAVSNRRVFRQYGPDNFGLGDLDRLARALVAMNRRGVSFVLSYAYCREALQMFKRWAQRKVFVRRNIAGFTTSRRFSAELIISNLSNPITK